MDPAISFPPGCTLVAGRGREPGERRSSLHQHPQGQLLGSTHGLLTVGTELGVWVVPAIHAIWFPPHQPHWARSHGPMDGWTVYISEPKCAGLPSKACTIRTSGLLREAVARAATWPAGPPDQAGEILAQVILNEISSLPVERFSLPLPRDPRLLRICRALLDDPSDSRGVPYWSVWAAISERSLSRRFVLETGFTFRAWRQRARLVRSLELLAEGQQVTTLALDLGYATASAFIAVFKQTFGQTPSSFRASAMAIGSEQ